MPVRLSLAGHDEFLLIVPWILDAGNNGALSSQSFEMLDLNFQVSIEHRETGCTGEREKE
jgi:hypothetical protein